MTEAAPITIRPNWFVRAMRATPIVRALLPIESPTEFRAGSDFLASYAPPPAYPSRGAMSAMGAFPWVVACCSAVSVDLASVPIRVSAGGVRLEAHPLLGLLEHPTERTAGINLLHQWLTDFLLVGWAPLLVLDNPATGEPESLIRMHPSRVTIRATQKGEPDVYVYNEMGSQSAYSYNSVICPRSPSFEDGPESVYGQGAIRALHRDLQADLSAQKLAERSSATGRPSAVARPATGSGVDRWNQKQIRDIKQALGKLQGSSAHGGIAVLNGLVDIITLGWSPRDMEFGDSRRLTRETVLAAFHVPPSRVGLPTANYATQRQQMATYWTHLKGIAALFSSELSRLGSRYAQPVRVHFDFSAVEALQTERTERLNRVSQHIINGLAPSDAYRAEGFDTIAEMASSTEFDSDKTARDMVIDALEGDQELSIQARSQLADMLRTRVGFAA